jgi:hypothetical protein
MLNRIALLLPLLVACGGGGEDGAGGGGGESPAPSGGAGGSGGGAACVCNAAGDAYDDKLCFCEDAGFGCSAEIAIDRVLEPVCPGSLIHPISPSCKIGGVLYPADNDNDYQSEAFYFDRDTEELVGLYASIDVEVYCDGLSSSVRWGDIAASCELCDPCGDNPEFPACPAPRE